MNEWEARNRLVKARKMAALLRRAMIQKPDVVTIPAIQAAGDDFRQLVAREAGCTPPSAETWDWIIELLREPLPPDEALAHEPACAACGLADRFCECPGGPEVDATI